ncbi:hypothetical protein ASE00_15670 [Sphingomonas sp. Root710]|uniref:HtaA domain-containing protein n=1 Tax=Sphingomonas sp. Root710 TaxID=1736594 RepID=UPI00070081A4|nr:HtaA domain-containing protein [Sphingomonas sp. Root710]KRB81413.1 hypothetical protein ASE00_15670 [Sphingomonas sp. Root710]
MDENDFSGLGWPIKTSFARYVGSLPDGRAALRDPIKASQRTGLVFPLADGGNFDGGSGTGVLRFSGGIGFTGHFGMLRVDIADPWLRIDGDTGILSIAAGADKRLDLASFRLAWDDAAHRDARGEALALTAAGAELFGSAYGEGTELDSFILHLIG